MGSAFQTSDGFLSVNSLDSRNHWQPPTRRHDLSQGFGPASSYSRVQWKGNTSNLSQCLLSNILSVDAPFPRYHGLCPHLFFPKVTYVHLDGEGKMKPECEPRQD